MAVNQAEAAAKRVKAAEPDGAVTERVKAAKRVKAAERGGGGQMWWR